jgi:hypothetical protein
MSKYTVPESNLLKYTAKARQDLEKMMNPKEAFPKTEYINLGKLLVDVELNPVMVKAIILAVDDGKYDCMTIDYGGNIYKGIWEFENLPKVQSLLDLDPDKISNFNISNLALNISTLYHMVDTLKIGENNYSLGRDKERVISLVRIEPKCN